WAQTPETPTDPWAQAGSDLPADASVRFGVLPNGMQYAIMRNATPPERASLRLRIDAGSLMENEHQLGLAHFMELMAFNGTTNVPQNDLLSILERLGLAFGADTNAATGFDQTFYILEVPRTNDETIDTALHIMREQVSEALMDPVAIDEERGVIEGEERLRNTPSLRASRAQLDLLAPGQRISQRMPIGDLEIIRTAPRERFVEFYNSFYRPSRATFIAVGDFDVDVMERKIRAAFADWTSRGAPGAEPDLGVAAPRAPETRVMVEAGLSSSIAISWTRPPDLEPDTVARRRKDLVQNLGLAVLNRRFAEMSRTDNPPFVTASSATDDLARSVQVATVSAAFVPGQWRRALETIDQEQRRLVEYGVSEAELQREITSWRTVLENAVAGAATRQTSGLSNGLLSAVNDKQVFTTPQTNLDLFNAAVDGLSIAEMNAAIKPVFEGGGPLIMVTSPVALEGGEAAVTAALETSRGVAVAALGTPEAKAWDYTNFGAPGVVKSRRELAELGATEVTFENGVVLVVKPTTFADESISVQIVTGIGDQAFSPTEFDPRQAAINTLRSGGLGRLNVDEISRALNGRVVGGGLGVAENRFTLGGATRPEDLELEMQFLAAHLTDPAFRSAPYEQMKALYPASLELTRATPGGAFGMEAGALLAGGDRRKAVVPAELVASWAIEPIRDSLKDLLEDGPLHITMVGDVTLEDAIRTTGATFGALPPRPPRAAGAPGADVRRFPAPTPQPLRFTHTGPAEQALGFIAWPTIDAKGDRTRARRIQMLTEVLKLRVVEEIRERQALAYSPGVSATFSEVYDDYGYVSITAQTAADKLPAFFAAVDDIIAKLTTGQISEDELNRARAPMIASARRAMNSNGWWLLNLADVQENPQNINQVLDGVADMEAVTPEDLQTLAREYLRPETAWKATVTAQATPAA
ncbi:MAG TPA: insulinase family protein, partial [Brevundimonas sp.]